MRLLDLFCGRLGWSRAFAARGWECVGIDLVEPPEIMDNFVFEHGDVLKLVLFRRPDFRAFDFIVAGKR